MSEKITLQSLSDAFAASNGLTKKLADNFLKQFFEVVQEGLLADGMVKVKGLGTFKLVEIADRESVSVSTGERFVIPGYKKVSFVPDEEINSMLTERIGVEDMPEEAENGVDEADVNVDDSEDKIVDETVEMTVDEEEKKIEDTEVEKPDNEFSAIDLLISTPESIEEARLNLQQAREAAESMQRTAEEALNAAREAHREVIRLEVLVKRLETNAVLEAKPGRNTDAALSQDSVQNSAETVERVGHNRAEAVVTKDDDEVEASTSLVNDADNEGKGKSGRKVWIVSVLLLLLLIALGGGYWYYNCADGGENIVVADSVQHQVDSQVVPLDTAVVDTMSIDTLVNDSVPADSLYKDTVSVQTVERADSVKPIKVKPKEVQKTEKVTPKAEVVTQPVQKKAPVKPEERPKTYKMKNGDTLMKIARRFYGDASYAVDIINANHFSDPNNVHIGTEIILP